jgi:MFS family permease
MSGELAGLPAVAPVRPPPGLRRTFAALRFPNYRRWFFGQMISLFGTWMQMTAQGYLVYDLTRSSAYLGYVAFASGVPTWLFMLYGGVVADRVSRRTLMVVTQSAMMLLALVLSALTFTGVVEPWHILVLAALLGVANAFDAPARQAFVLEMVDRAHLTNAIALNSTMFNCATALGPAASGLVYAAFGPGFCFAINGLTFLAVIGSLLSMRLAPRTEPARKASGLADLLAGLRYVFGHSVIRVLIALVGLVTLFGLSFATLLPAITVTVLGGDARTLGWLQSSRGFGSLLGALLVASLGTVAYKGRLLTWGSLALPAMLFLFGLTRWLPLSLLTLVGLGTALILTLNVANALVQTVVEDGMRGRVMAAYSLTFFGLMPLGGLLAGAVAHRVGEPVTVLASAVVLFLAAALIALLLPRIRALP